MSAQAGPTPHRLAVDPTKLRGITALGEPLPLLLSALLRLHPSVERDGMVEIDARLPSEEVEALERAMARAERDIPGDRRTRGQRDLDRLLAVAERVSEIACAVVEGRRLDRV